MELANAIAIISHTCEAYPPRKEFSWLDVVPYEGEEK